MSNNCIILVLLLSKILIVFYKFGYNILIFFSKKGMAVEQLSLIDEIKKIVLNMKKAKTDYQEFFNNKTNKIQFLNLLSEDINQLRKKIPVYSLTRCI